MGFSGVAVPLFYPLCMGRRAKCSPRGNKLLAVSSFLLLLPARFSSKLFLVFHQFSATKRGSISALERVEQVAEYLLQGLLSGLARKLGREL